MLNGPLRAVLLAAVVTVAAAATLASALSLLTPKRFVATARVLVPAGSGLESSGSIAVSTNGASRVMTLEYTAPDPQLAADTLNAFLQTRKDSVVIDPATALAAGSSLEMNLAFGGAAGLLLGIGVAVARERRRRPVHSEGDLLEALGAPLLAARPLRREAMRGLCVQLLEHWFSPARPALAIVSPEPGDGRSHVAAELALSFAAMGVKTLLIDADLRSPGQHRVFKLPNRWGLAGFLAGGLPRPAACLENLSVLMAGSASRDPLELLTSRRLPALLAEAGKRFRVVLIDTPAAARGPDFQMFAALCGGALVVARQDRADAGALRSLNADLKRTATRVVATVLNGR